MKRIFGIIVIFMISSISSDVWAQHIVWENNVTYLGEAGDAGETAIAINPQNSDEFIPVYNFIQP